MTEAEPEDEAPAHQQLVLPWERLSETALHGIIDEFVTREGTEYGRVEIALETKRKQVRAQLERGDVVLVYDTALGTANLITREELKALEAGAG